MTSTGPTACCGVTAEMVVGDKTLKLVALYGPNKTAVTLAKLVPVIVTVVPPPIEPVAGLMPVTVGAGAANVNLSAAVIADAPSGLDTITSKIPAACAGATAVIEEDAELNVNDVAAMPSKETAVTSARPAPVIVTGVPPAMLPLEGLMPVMLGGTAW